MLDPSVGDMVVVGKELVGADVGLVVIHPLHVEAQMLRRKLSGVHASKLNPGK